MYGDDTVLGIKKGSRKVDFDIVINTPKGLLFCMYFKHKESLSEKNLLSTEGSEGIKVSTKKKQISATLAHEILGHMGEARRRAATTKHMGFELTRGSLQAFESCATGKAKQKNVPQISDHNPATKINERIFLDISTIKEPKDNKTY